MNENGNNRGQHLESAFAVVVCLMVFFGFAFVGGIILMQTQEKADRETITRLEEAYGLEDAKLIRRSAYPGTPKDCGKRVHQQYVEATVKDKRKFFVLCDGEIRLPEDQNSEVFKRLHGLE